MSQPSKDLPVYEILEVIQTSGHPALKDLDSDQIYQIENSLQKPVNLRRRPRLPGVMRPSDVRLVLNFRDKVIDPVTKKHLQDEDGVPLYTDRVEKAYIRHMDTADMFDIAAIGPQILEEFFGGNEDLVAQLSYAEIAQQVIIKSVAQRLQNAITDLAEAVLDKCCSLVIISSTQTPLEIDDLFHLPPEQGQAVLQKSLEVNTVFFSSLGSRIPENIKGALRSLTGTLSFVGNQIADHLGMKE